MKKKYFAFTMIELLIVMSIMLILIFLTTGVVSKVKSKSKEMQTQNIFSFIKHALQMYCNATGNYPIINNGNNINQEKLYNCLVNISETTPLILKNYKDETVKKITSPFISQDELLKNGYAANNRFIDAWGNNIYYFYGSSIVANTFYNPPGNENYNYKNEYYDLISFGKNGASLLSTPTTQKDDIKNF